MSAVFPETQRFRHATSEMGCLCLCQISGPEISTTRPCRSPVTKAAGHPWPVEGEAAAPRQPVTSPTTAEEKLYITPESPALLPLLLVLLGSLHQLQLLLPRTKKPKEASHSPFTGQQFQIPSLQNHLLDLGVDTRHRVSPARKWKEVNQRTNKNCLT